MSAEPTLSLSRRAVACPGWRWMPGMLDQQGCVRLPHRWAYPDGQAQTVSDFGKPPDLTSPATLGCLLALVREAWSSRSQGVSVIRRWLVGGVAVAPGWEWEVWRTEPSGPHVLGRGATEAEALVCALEAAPR